MKCIRINSKVKIVDFSAPRHILSGTPQTGAANIYSDRSGQFHCGIWESSPGKWQVAYEEEEFCLILSGRVRVTSDTGESEDYGPEDAFVIPAGFRGTWETLESLRKYYVIFEAKPV